MAKGRTEQFMTAGDRRMAPSIAIFVLIASVLYGGINYYIGSRLYMHLGRLPYTINSRGYWIVFWLLALSYIILQFGGKYLPKGLANLLNFTGQYWMGIMFYSIIILVLIDLVRLSNRWFNFIPEGVKGNQFIVTSYVLGIFVVLAGIIAYGTYNAKNPRIKHYDITINKKVKNMDTLHAVMVSDIHIGRTIDRNRVTRMVEEINKLNPDVVLIAGDILDHQFEPFLEQNMQEIFRKISSKYGVYASLGNHDYFGGDIHDIVKAFEDSGIRVLRDSYVKINEDFYIAGREDEGSNRFTGAKRRDIKEILKDVDRNLPVILLDHRPVDLDNSQGAGVDLQLSGHTHRGQMYPASLITNKIFEVDFGYYFKGTLHTIVSSGFGTWGPPLRIGNRSEIVDINISFEN